MKSVIIFMLVAWVITFVEDVAVLFWGRCSSLGVWNSFLALEAQRVNGGLFWKKLCRPELGPLSAPKPTADRVRLWQQPGKGVRFPANQNLYNLKKKSR
jgi:hypothetical protein